jgi:hypothetical protein
VFEQDEPVLERVVDELRAPVRMNRDLDARVMAQIARERDESALTRSLRWITEPRLVAVTPLKAFAMAAGLLLVVSLARGTRGGADAVPAVAVVTPSVQPVASANTSDTTVIQFVFVAPSASSVSLVGDFNGWDAARTQLRPAQSGGMWSVALPLPPGRHRYAFIVDGKQWVLDPAAPRAVEDDFGSPNSVVTVGEKTT